MRMGRTCLGASSLLLLAAAAESHLPNDAQFTDQFPLERLTAVKVPTVHRLVTGIREPYAALVVQLEQTVTRDPERAGAALVDVVGPQMTLRPDESGTFLWAEYGLEMAPLMAVAGGACNCRSGGPLLRFFPPAFLHS